MTAETRAPHDLNEAVLELRDQMIGIQAQLDELHARIDGLEHRVGRHSGTRVGLSRVRSSVRRLRRPPPSAQATTST